MYRIVLLGILNLVFFHLTNISVSKMHLVHPIGWKGEWMIDRDLD